MSSTGSQIGGSASINQLHMQRQIAAKNMILAKKIQTEKATISAER
jgi:hypothetical protein